MNNGSVEVGMANSKKFFIFRWMEYFAGEPCGGVEFVGFIFIGSLFLLCSGLITTIFFQFILWM